MTNEGKIGLLMSKAQVFKFNFLRSTKNGDTEAAAKWKAGYQAIKGKIRDLKEEE
jgi:hypothetical protein